MAREPIAEMSLSQVYPLLVQKAERTGRTRAEGDPTLADCREKTIPSRLHCV